MITQIVMLASLTAATNSRVARPSTSQAKLLVYEIGAVIHFNMQTFDDKMKVGHVAYPDKFNASELSTDHWIEAAKSFGAKYAVLTLDHFSGFLLWPSSTYNYTVRNTTWKRGRGNIAAEFIQSCKRHGLEYGFYYSAHNNWFMGVSNYTAKNSRKQKKYNQIVQKHMSELLGSHSIYKDPFFLWFDAGLIPGTSANIGPIIKRLANETVCFECPGFSGKQGARWVGNERAEVSLPNWYPVAGGKCQTEATGDPLGTQFCPAMCNTVLRSHHWFWKPNTDNKRQQTRQLVHSYLTSVGRGCPLILNIAPDRRGLVPTNDVWSYEKLGRAIELLYSDPVLQVGEPELIVGKSRTWHFLHPLEAANGSVVLMEDIEKYGQLVESYEVTYLIEPSKLNHKETGSTIGHKRIHPFPWQPDPLEKDPELLSITGLRIKVTKLVTGASKIRLRKVSVYDWSTAVAHGLL